MLAAIDAAIPPRYCGYGCFGLETGIIWALAVEDMMTRLVLGMRKGIYMEVLEGEREGGRERDGC